MEAATKPDDGMRRAALPGARWYCVHTKPRAEARALEHLERQGFDCFLPRLRRNTRRDSRRGTCIEPLFPRYLFLHADPARQSLATVRSTRGALGLVRFGQRIAEVPEALIARLRRDAGPDGLIVPAMVLPCPGDTVAILDGAFAGMTGLYAQQHSEQRAIVLLQILGGRQRVMLSTDLLQRCGSIHAT